MKVCYFAEMYSPAISGTSIILQEIVQELRNRNYEAYVITPSYSNSLADEENVIRLRSLPLPKRFDVRLSLPSKRKIMQQIEFIQPDILHSHQPSILGRIALQIGRKFDIPTITTIHTYYNHEKYLSYVAPIPIGLARRVMNWNVRNFCNQCAAVTTPAIGMVEYLENIGVRTPIYMIPNGIDTSTFSYQKSQDIAESQHKILLYVGRLAKEKNLEFLLRSFALTQNACPDVRLWIAGDGAERSVLEQLAKSLGIAGQVHFLGWVNQDELPALYQSAGLFLTASTSEVSPLTVIEALSSGTPIVAIDCFSMRQILRDNIDGILTSPNIEAFSEAILYLLNTPEKRLSMAQNAKENGNTYTISRHVDALLNLYMAQIDR